MDPHADLHGRIDRLCERARVRIDGELVDEMNDVLSEGYARALLADRRVVELDERVVDVLLRPDVRRARELRALTEERRAAARAVARLRARLAAMHEQYLALRAG
jgi:hypothetical protein